MKEDGSLKRRKKPRERRQGKLTRLADLLHELGKKKGKILTDEEEKEETDRLLRELRAFDITEIGGLYLTPKKRIVLDKGYGEYFSDADIELFTKQELTQGINIDKFEERLEEAKKEMKIE